MGQYELTEEELRQVDDVQEFQIQPQKIAIVAEIDEFQCTPMTLTEESHLNPYNLQDNVTHRSEFYICNGDTTHDHLISQEEQLTHGSHEVEIAESANAYTDSNGDTEYDGACHSAAITAKDNSAYQHTMSSLASSQSRALVDHSNDSSTSQDQSNSRNQEKGQIDDIILIEAPSKEFDQE